MSKAKRPSESGNRAGGPVPKDEAQPALSAFLNGPKAKWVFFAIYFVLTVFLFREFLFSDTMLFGSDTIPDGIYTRGYYKDYHAEFGGIPRWNPFLLGGLPFIDAMHGDTFYPGAWIQFFMPLTRALGHKLIWHVLLAGIGMYAFLRTLRLRRDAAFLGGLMYLLAPSFVSLVFPGHDAKMYVTALLPFAFALLEAGMNVPRLWKFALLGGVMGLLILTSHVQMAYYSYWALGLYFLFRLFIGRKEGAAALGKRTALFAGAVALAVALGLIQLLPSYKFTTVQSVRSGEARTSYEYATSWSMHPEEVMGMLIPSFPGFDLGQQFYWGRNPFKLNSEYNGILPIIFAIAALAAWRRSRTWFFLGLGALALIYAVGATTPLYHFFYSFVPGVKNFRAPGMIIFLFAFAAIALSAMFLSALLDRKIAGGGTGRKFLYAAGGVFLFALVVSVMGRSFFDLWNGLFYRGIEQSRLDIMAANIPNVTADLWRAALIAAASLAGVWLFLSRKIGSAALVALLALAVTVDAAVVNSRFIRVLDPTTYSGLVPDQSVKDIQTRMNNSSPFRVLNTIISVTRMHSPNYYAMFGIQSADGAHNNELKTYERFRGQNSANLLDGWVDFQSGQLNPLGIPNNNFLKVAGVKYILVPGNEGRIELIENFGALDRAFIAHDYTVAEDDSAAVALLKNPGFDASRRVVLNGEPALAPAPADSTRPSGVENMVYRAKSVEIGASLGAPGILALSENWVPYWRAEIDGKPAPILRAYGTFMAVAVPEGKHQVNFIFHSGPYQTGKTVTLAALGLIALMLPLSGGLALVRRKRKGTAK
ncbi:MAG: hypothetical protein ACYC9O_10675 [Candidatus Latescibacterota bacterium]